jgi:4-hydroxybenzoyl-CoA thioesterase
VPSRHTVRIAWGDCDAAGIVFFPRYFEWFDAATHVMFERAGLSFAQMSQKFSGMTIPLKATRATFLRPSTYGDEVLIETDIARWGRSSFDVQHRLLRGEEMAVECVETRVWTLRTTDNRLEGRAIPAEVKELFTKALFNAATRAE